MREQKNDACIPSGLLPPCIAAHEGLCMPEEDRQQPPITDPQSSDDFALALALQQMEDEEMMNTTERRQPHPNNAFEKVGVVSRYNTQTVFRHSTFQAKSNTHHCSSDYVEAKQKQAELTELGGCPFSYCFFSFFPPPHYLLVLLLLLLLHRRPLLCRGGFERKWYGDVIDRTSTNQT